MMDHIIPFGVVPQVYLYEHPQAEEDGVLECQAIVVMRRAHGFMAALPSGVFSEPELAEGAEAGMEALVGPSLQVQVSAALLTEEGPIPQPGVSLPCLLVIFPLSRPLALHAWALAPIPKPCSVSMPRLPTLSRSPPDSCSRPWFGPSDPIWFPRGWPSTRPRKRPRPLARS